MTVDEFRQTLADSTPSSTLSPALTALWFDGRGEWARAHDVAQDIAGADGAWIHAYLHRKEGDEGNAAYWYRRAGQPIARGSLEIEWAQMVAALLRLQG